MTQAFHPDCFKSFLWFYTEHLSVLASSETCSVGQLVPLNSVTKTTQASDFTLNLDLLSSLILFYTEHLSVLASSETCYTSQTPALNPAKKISQARGYSLSHVNAQSLSGSFRTLFRCLQLLPAQRQEVKNGFNGGDEERNRVVGHVTQR